LHLVQLARARFPARAVQEGDPMRRFIAAYAILGATTLACSAAPDSTSSAQSALAAPADEVVTITGFDRQTLVLTAVNAEGETMSLQYTPDTSALAANLAGFEPPDPCFAQATAYDHQIDRGLTQALIERLVQFARFSCNAAVTLGEGNVVLSFQPVAHPPEPT
jgi:hypothetical protein